MRSYTIYELNKLKHIRAKSINGSTYHEIYETAKTLFEIETSQFLNWIQRMEKENKIETLLTQQCTTK